MTGKVFGVIVGVVAIIILAICMPAIPDAVESFRTDSLTQSFTVSTGVGVTTASVALSKALWDSSVVYVTNASSNTTADSVVADNYTVANKSLNLTGLSGNTTRTLSVTYRSGGLSANPAADTAALYFPGIVVGFIMLIPIVFFAYLILGNR